MKKVFFFFFFIASFFFVLALMYGPVDLSVVPVQISPQQSNRLYNYTGVINVHSEASTGSGSIEEIGAAAQDAELDFVVITDTNNFTIPAEREKYYGKSLVMVDGEYSYLDSRLLYLNFNDVEGLQGLGRSQLVISELLSRESSDQDQGFFVLSHPLKSGFQWSGPMAVGMNGIEIYNLRYIWQRAWEEKRSSFLWALFLYPVNSQWSFARLFASYTDPEIGYWDRLTQTQKIFGFAGADAESRARMPGGKYWNIPSYKTLFSVLRNHVLTKSELTGNPPEDRKKLMESLRLGNFYIGFDLIGDTSGFDTSVVGSGGEYFPMGSTIPQEKARQLIVDLSHKPSVPFEIRVIKDGEDILTSNSPHVAMDIQGPGVYRVLVRVRLNFPFPDQDRWLPWITSNPFFIR